MPRVHKQKQKEKKEARERNTRLLERNIKKLEETNENLEKLLTASYQINREQQAEIISLRAALQESQEEYDSFTNRLAQEGGVRFLASHRRMNQLNNNLRRRVAELEAQQAGDEYFPPVDRSFSTFVFRR